MLKTTSPNVITVKNLMEIFERIGSVCESSVGAVGRQASVKAGWLDRHILQKC